MSKYDKINEEFNDYFKYREIYLDDFDKTSITIVSYEDLDEKDLTDIEEEIFSFAKPILNDVSPRLETQKNGKTIPYILLEYKANIGEDELSDDELHSKNKNDFYPMGRGGGNDPSL